MNAEPELRDTEALQRVSVATDWVLRLRDESLSDDAIGDWLRWCEADPRNQHAFDRAQELWALTRELSPASIDPRLARAGSGKRSKHWWIALAASFLGATALLVAIAYRPWPGDGVIVAQSPVSFTRLPDGSSMQFGAGTEVAMRYSTQRRELELRNGEAYFSVAHDVQRPFVVSAGDLRVRAVGTAFNVRRAANRVVVTVVQGTVDVWSITSDRAQPMRLQAGGQIAWNEGAAPSISNVNPNVVLAWREGRLNYDAEPLEAVVADVSRYSDHPIRVVKGSLDDLYFTGTVLTGETDEWVRALPGSFDVTVRSQADGSLHIERR